MDCILGLDLGTSRIKAIILDRDGNEVAVQSKKLNVISSDKYAAELNMDKLWNLTVDLIKMLMNTAIIKADEVKAIGITAQGDGCWLIDKSGKPVHNAILWSDGRAQEIIDYWQEEGIINKIWSLNHSVLFSGAQGAILRWFKENDKEVLEKAYKVIYCKDWIAYKLTGVIATDQTEASYPVYDIRKRRYSEEIMKLLELGNYFDLLPEVISTNQVRGELSKKVADELNLKGGIPVVAGPFDALACAIGVGAVDNKTGVTILGSTAFNAATINKIDEEEKQTGFTYCHFLNDKWVRGLGAMVGTPNLDWFLDKIGSNIKEEAQKSGKEIYNYADSIVAGVPAGARGVVYHPYISISGERAPFVNPFARAQFTGLNYNHNINDMLRAIYEGVSLSIKDCYENISSNVEEIRLCGGGSRSKVWCQMIADVTGKVIKISAGTEFGAKGAAINAGCTVGIYGELVSSINELINIKEEYYPRQNLYYKYREIYNYYLSVRQKMEALWKEDY
jgi:sugar (pentulose or hexulose) kinase